MSSEDTPNRSDLYILIGPSASGKTTLANHVAKSMSDISEKHDWFDYPILTISDDYAFAPEEELTLENLHISDDRLILKNYSYPSLDEHFSQLNWDQIVTARYNFYRLVNQKVSQTLSRKPFIFLVEGTLIQREADIELIGRVLETDSAHVVLMDMGYEGLLKSPRWQERKPPRRHRYHELMSKIGIDTDNVISSFKQASLPWWPYQSKTMPSEVKFNCLGLEKLDPAGKTVVDLCCNEGGIAAHCAKTGARAMGVDHNFMAFVMATHEYPEVEYQLEETFRWLDKQRDKSLDIGLLLGSFHYFPQTHLLLTELARVFKTVIMEPVLTADDYEGDGLLHRPPPYNDVIMTRAFFESYVQRYFKTVHYHGPSVPPKDGSNRHIYHLLTS